MSARGETLASWALLVALSASCKPPLDDELSRVTGPRILAVQAIPAEARPGESVTLRALYTDGVTDGATSMSTAPLEWSFCVARRALAEPTSLSAACLRGDPGALLLLGSGTGVAGVVPADVCRSFGPERPLGTPGEPAGRAADPDPTGGYYLPGVVRGPEVDDAQFELRVRCGLAGATQADVAAFERTYRSNTNPVVEEVVVTRGDRAESVAEGAEIRVSAGEVVRIRASWPACAEEAPCGGAERFPAFDNGARVLIERREALRVSWLATGGRFAEARTGRAEEDPARDVETSWTAPASPDGPPTQLWLVLRDTRGGTGLRTLRVRAVAP